MYVNKFGHETAYFVCNMGLDITHFRMLHMFGHKTKFLCVTCVQTYYIPVRNVSSDRIHLIFVCNICSDITHFRMLN